MNKLALGIAFLTGPAAMLLGMVIGMALAPKPRNRRVAAVYTRIRTPACEQPPMIYAPENGRVRTLN